MRYLNRYKNFFSSIEKDGAYRFYIKPTETLNGLSSAVSALNNAERAKGVSRTSTPLQLTDRRIFLKRFAAGDFKHMLRMTFGLKRRQGGFDWPIAELVNSCEVLTRGGNIPDLKAFGFCFSPLGLIKEVFLIFELMDGYIDGLQWLELIKDNPDAVELFLTDCVALIANLHQREIYHLDPWLENIMLHPSQPRRLFPIDVENCFIGKPPSAFTVTGFQFGYMFQRGPMQVFQEERFDRIVKGLLQTYPGFDATSLNAYEICKRAWLGRKQRQLTPLGIIDADKTHPFPHYFSARPSGQD